MWHRPTSYMFYHAYFVYVESDSHATLANTSDSAMSQAALAAGRRPPPMHHWTQVYKRAQHARIWRGVASQSSTSAPTNEHPRTAYRRYLDLLGQAHGGSTEIHPAIAQLPLRLSSCALGEAYITMRSAARGPAPPATSAQGGQSLGPHHRRGNAANGTSAGLWWGAQQV